MQNLLLLLLLASPALLAAQAKPAPVPAPIDTYKISLHEFLSRSCEVVQAATLIEYKEYDALVLAGTKDELYSPELSKGAFVTLPVPVSNNALKAVKKSGFEVRRDASGESGSSESDAVNGTSCPTLEQAVSELKQERNQRRIELQGHIRKIGKDVLPPIVIRQTQPESTDKQVVTAGSAAKVRKEGTTIIAFVVDKEGNVHNPKVVQSLDAVDDQTAIESIRQWQFLPSRMRGLPVPVAIDLAVTFHLY